MNLVDGHRRSVTTNDHDQSKFKHVLSCDNIFRTVYETPLKRWTPFWGHRLAKVEVAVAEASHEEMQ
jgi:hypothetical protein